MVDKAKPAPEVPKSERIATNRQAGHYYFIIESCEAGIVLQGTEVKSLRDRLCNLNDAFARFEKDELFLYNLHIGAYAQGNLFNHEPTRPRKLLLKKRQLKRLFGLLTQQGLTLIPLSLYFKHGIAKCDIAVAKSKKIFDRRADIKKRIVQREVARAMRRKK